MERSLHLSPSDVIRYILSDVDIKVAKQRAERQGELDRSFMDNERSVNGCVGERVFEVIAGDRARYKPCLDYDFVMVANGIKVDIKTATRNVKPRLSYEASVERRPSGPQACDVYVFISLLANLERAWIIGYMFQNEYLAMARECDAGEYVPNIGDNRRADCINLDYRYLGPIQWLFNKTGDVT